jgi:hypothetical protein
MGKMRALLLLLAIPLLATFAPLEMAEPPVVPQRPFVTAEPVPLREDAPGDRRLGGLTFLGGWWLRSNHPDFGGISAMHVEGGRVLALGDGGVLMGFGLPARRGRTTLWTMPLPDVVGKSKTRRDTEAMAIAGGSAWVAFERRNSIHRYKLKGWQKDAEQQPAAMKGWSSNSGGEAMVRLRNGRFLVFCEGRTGEEATEVVLFEGDPAVAGTRAMRLRYRPPPGYRITDAAELPGGGLLFLNRRVGLPEGFSAKLTLMARPSFVAGSVLEGEEIADFAPPVTTDNYEALSVTQESGRTILWIASDDNFIELERTLLMKFALN